MWEHYSMWGGSSTSFIICHCFSLHSTGQCVDELKDSKARTYLSHVYDMYINGDTLVAPRHNENTVLFYKLR